MGFFCAGYTASRVWIACGRTKSEHASRNRKPLCCAGLGLTGPPRARDVEGRGEVSPSHSGSPESSEGRAVQMEGRRSLSWAGLRPRRRFARQSTCIFLFYGCSWACCSSFALCCAGVSWVGLALQWMDAIIIHPPWAYLVLLPAPCPLSVLRAPLPTRSHIGWIVVQLFLLLLDSPSYYLVPYFFLLYAHA
ncbi:hypothetical protein IWW34DRAFT_201928 [Fusarium oxysporum f. sp. albedinis]|nr:hypothetical protein IWW34DRAFT_201928 [Fusarium oxysporum f. sp. albedinis]